MLQITSKRSIPGGAANVARNISRLGGRAALYGFFEGDEASRKILSELRAEGVQVLSAPPTSPFRLPERRRFFASNHQLIQILQRPGIDRYADSLAPLGEFAAGLPSRPRTVVVYDQGLRPGDPGATGLCGSPGPGPGAEGRHRRPSRACLLVSPGRSFHLQRQGNRGSRLSTGGARLQPGAGGPAGGRKAGLGCPGDPGKPGDDHLPPLRAPGTPFPPTRCLWRTAPEPATA